MTQQQSTRWITLKPTPPVRLRVAGRSDRQKDEPGLGPAFRAVQLACTERVAGAYGLLGVDHAASRVLAVAAGLPHPSQVESGCDRYALVIETSGSGSDPTFELAEVAGLWAGTVHSATLPSNCVVRVVAQDASGGLRASVLVCDLRR